MADKDDAAGGDLGLAWYEYVSQSRQAAAVDTPFRTVGVTDFVFGTVWPRPGLDARTRRFVSLTCAAMGSAQLATRSLIYSSLKSGDITLEEMREFVLHFAVYAGWPKAAAIDGEVTAAWERVESEGGPGTGTPRPAS